jgi:hypothetical protein
LTTQNAAQFINLSIRNALLQSTPPRTIFVLDVHSSDETEKMVGSIYARIPTVRFISSKSSSIGRAREEALGLSDTPYVAFLECTQENHPRWSINYLEQQINHLKNQPEAIGSLGTVCTNEPANDTYPLLIQLPASGLASNMILRKEAALTDTQLLEQLRMAEEHHQWQLLFTIFSFSLADQALTYASASLTAPINLQAEPSMKQCKKIFSWWSKNIQVIQSNPKLLKLIRQAFTSTASAPKLSLLKRLNKLHHTYYSLIPSLDASLFSPACRSYYSLVFEIILEHYKQLWISCKQSASHIPIVTKVYQLFSR